MVQKSWFFTAEQILVDLSQGKLSSLLATDLKEKNRFYSNRNTLFFELLYICIYIQCGDGGCGSGDFISYISCMCTCICLNLKRPAKPVFFMLHPNLLA